MARGERTVLSGVLFGLGVTLLVPPFIGLYRALAFYTIELRPWWIPELLLGMAALGCVMIVSGVCTLRHR